MEYRAGKYFASGAGSLEIQASTDTFYDAIEKVEDKIKIRDLSLEPTTRERMKRPVIKELIAIENE